MSTRARHLVPLRRQRMFKRILESYLDRGRPLAEAEELAARTVNKYRAAHACRGRVCKHKGPRLVGAGGSRVQWYPGKRTRREVYACLAHGRKFRTKAKLQAHYRRSHGRK